MRHAAPLLRRVSDKLPQQLYISQDEDGHDILALEILPRDTQPVIDKNTDKVAAKMCDLNRINDSLPSFQRAKENAGHISTVDRTIKKLARLPHGILTVLFIILRKLDYFGANLSFLTDGDINYCSILVSNLGSVGMSSIYHHLNNYGTNSMVVTLGKIHKEEVIYPDGSREVRDLLDIGTTVDERVADGFYYSQGVILLKKIIENRELLDIPLGNPIE